LLKEGTVKKSGVKTGVCEFRRPDGTSCRAVAIRGASLCFFHHPGFKNQRALARIAGGIARTANVEITNQIFAKQLRSSEDVIELLSEAINLVGSGKMSARVANAIGYLSGTLLNAIEKRDESRLAALEKIVSYARQLPVERPQLDRDFKFVNKDEQLEIAKR
jgi:hypothetical protein